MQRTMQILVGLVALALLGLGLNFLLNPLGGAAQWALVPEGIRGLNSLRGDFGGMFIGCAIVLLIGLLRQETLWFLAVAVTIGSIALSRCVGFALDGFAGNSVPEFVAEVAMVAVLVLAHLRARPAA